MNAVAELVKADVGMPVEWSAAKLGDVVQTMIAGVSVNADNRPLAGDEVGVLRTSCVSGGQFLGSEHKAVLPGEVSRVRTPVRSGSIIISRMNTPALVGANAYVDEDHPDLFLPDRLWQLRTNGQADCRWLSYFMQSAAFRLFIDDIATGTSGSMKNISKERLLQLPLTLPPLDEQRRIAEVLRSVDEAIASTQATLSFCEDFLISQRREAFLHLIEEPGDTSTTFKDMCDLGRGFAFKSEDYQDTGVLNFRVTNVGKPVDDLGGQCFLPVAFMDTFEEYVLRNDEIVLVMVGATVGKLGRVPEAVCPALLNQNMWTLNAKAPFTHDLALLYLAYPREVLA